MTGSELPIYLAQLAEVVQRLERLFDKETAHVGQSSLGPKPKAPDKLPCIPPKCAPELDFSGKDLPPSWRL